MIGKELADYSDAAWMSATSATFEVAREADLAALAAGR